MTNKLFRKLVKWLGLIIVMHIVAMIIFGMMFSSMVAQMMEYELAVTRGKLTMLGFDILFFLIFMIITVKSEMSFLEYRRELKNAINDESFSSLSYYKNNFLKEHILKLVILIVFQLPLTLFYNFFGYMFDQITGFEQFYALDAGAYVLTESSILGLLVNILIFGVLIFVSWWTVFLLTKKGIQRDLAD